MLPAKTMVCYFFVNKDGGGGTVGMWTILSSFFMQPMKKSINSDCDLYLPTANDDQNTESADGF